jgi:hypothetical protein
MSRRCRVPYVSFARLNKDVDGRDKPGHDTKATVSLCGGWYKLTVAAGGAHIIRRCGFADRFSTRKARRTTEGHGERQCCVSCEALYWLDATKGTARPLPPETSVILCVSSVDFVVTMQRHGHPGPIPPLARWSSSEHWPEEHWPDGYARTERRTCSCTQPAGLPPIRT